MAQKPAGASRREGPTVVIVPPKRFVAIHFADLWGYRALLYFLIWRDIKVRYKQTALGAGWAILQPLLTMLIFSFCFGRLAKMPSNGIPYPLFALAGLVPWIFFANGVTTGGNSLISNTNLISKIYFPRILIPSSAVFAGLLDFAISFSSLLAMMIWYKVHVTWTIALLPVLVLLLASLALGSCVWMAALNVKYRDIKYALPFFVQMGMFATPIIYPSGLLPANWRWALDLNPMAGIVENFRAIMFGGQVIWSSLGMSALLTCLLLTTGAYFFRSLEASFADVI